MVSKICAVPIMVDLNNLDSRKDCFRIFSACLSNGLLVGKKTELVEDCFSMASNSSVRVSKEISNSLSKSNAFPSFNLMTASSRCSGATNSFFSRTASSLLIRIKSFTLGENFASMLLYYYCKYNSNLYPKFKFIGVETSLLTIKLQRAIYSHVKAKIVSKFLVNRVVFAGAFAIFVFLTKFIIIGLEDYGRR